MSVHTNPVREAYRSEPSKALLIASLIGASLFWGFALFLGFGL